MLSSLSSNVVLAKARAKYGKRLKEKDYRNLLDCKSVAEVAAYLKANTDYHDVLTGINEYDIHRGQLEVLIKQKLFYNLSSFVRYELSVGEQLADYVIARAEIEEILDALYADVRRQAGENIPRPLPFILPSTLKSTWSSFPASKPTANF